MTEKSLLSIAHVAEKLDVSTTTVRRLVKLGHLPEPKRVLGSPRWFACDVEYYLHLLATDRLPKIEDKK